MRRTRRPSPLERMINLLGRQRVRLLRLPCKIDDSILAADTPPRSGDAQQRVASMESYEDLGETVRSERDPPSVRSWAGGGVWTAWHWPVR